MSTDFTLGQGDTGGVLQMTLLNDEEKPVDLSSASVDLELAPPRGGLVVDADAEVVDPPTSGVVRYPPDGDDWPAGVVDTAQTLYGRFEVTFADGSVQSYPNDGYLTLTVTAAVGSPLPAGALCSIDDVITELKLTDKRPNIATIQRQIDAASQAICTLGKREFQQAQVAPETRLFVAGLRTVYELDSGLFALAIADAAEIVSVLDGGNTPVGYVAQTGKHGTYESVVLTAPLPAVVAVDARWGFPAVLPDIHEAAVKQAAAWYLEDSSRMSQSFALEARPSTLPAPRSLLYAVRDLVRPYRYTSLA